MQVMTLVTAMLLILTSAAIAQDADLKAGAAYAEQVCARCHAVQPHQGHSALLQTPSFQSMADTPDRTELALTVFMQSFHA